MIERTVGGTAGDLNGIQPGRISGSAVRRPASAESGTAGAAGARRSSSPGAGGSAIRTRIGRAGGNRSTPVFHYGDQRERLWDIGLSRMPRQYEDEPVFSQPALILHGVHDHVVPSAISTRYAQLAPERETDADGIRSRTYRRCGTDVVGNLDFLACSRIHRSRVYNPVSGLAL